MKIVTLDVETLTDTWNKEAPDWNGRLKFPPLTHHRPCVVGALSFDPIAGIQTYCWGADEFDEREVMLIVTKLLRESDRLVTFNGRSFDVPLLALRAMKNFQSWQWYNDRKGRYPRAGKQWHIDLMDQFSDYGAVRNISLDRLTRFIGLPGKSGIDGSKVQETWDSNPDGKQKVKRYCLEDVFDTWVLYLHWAVTFDGADTLPIEQTKKWAVDTPFAGRLDGVG